MIAETLMVLALGCPTTMVTNESTEAWNKQDQSNMNHAIKRCAEKFENSPCLIKFTKRAPQTYWAICGAKRDV